MDLQTMLTDILSFLSEFVVPVLIAIAVLVFFWNLFRFAFIQGTSSDGREKARRLMIWSILAFVLMFGIWGILRIVLTTFGIAPGGNGIVPDYQCEKTGVCESFDELDFEPVDDPCSTNPNSPFCGGGAA